MISLNFHTNVKQFARYLNRLEKAKLPFATAHALTKTAQEAQSEIQRLIPKTFNITKKWWLKQQPTGIKIKPANYKAQHAMYAASVYTMAYFAKLQEDGGLKFPYKGKGILVPTDYTPKYGRKSGGSTRVMAGKKTLRKGGRPKGSPIITMPSGKQGVFRRRGKKRLPIDLVYTYISSTAIIPRFRFKEKAAKAALMHFDKQFAKSLAYALRDVRK